MHPSPYAPQGHPAHEPVIDITADVQSESGAATLAWGGQQQGAAIDMLVGAPGARPAEHRMSEQLRRMTRLPLSGPEWGAAVAGALGVVLLFAAYATTWSTVSYSIGRTGQTATSTGTTRNIEYGISGMSAVGTIFVLGSMLLV